MQSFFFVQSKLVRNCLLFLGNLIVLQTILSWQTIAILTFVSAFVYLTGRAIDWFKSKLLLAFSIAALIGLFVLKNYQLVDLSILQRVGLSYILFRYIHFLVESYKKTIQSADLLTFLNYILFFPNFIAGPIDDYVNFDYWVRKGKNNYRWLMIKAGTFRLLVGIIKKFVLVPIILNHALDFSLFDGTDFWQLGLFYSLFFYSFYILFDFSGYTDIAIGTAYLIGIRTPENFDNPYYSFNLGSFWRKWHMTFSNFLFKYLFKPIVTYLSANFKKSPRLFISSIGYLVTFILCGIWHGNTLNFLYWGLWHGCGLILFKLWEMKVFKRHVQPKIKRFWLGVYRTGALSITFLYVTIGWFFFNYSSDEMSRISTNLFHTNTHQLKVNSVMIGSDIAYEIYYENDANKPIDIELIAGDTIRTVTYADVAVNENHLYYIYPQQGENALTTVRVREHNPQVTTPWDTYLIYLDTKNSTPSPIEEFVFGEKEYVKNITNTPEDALGFYLYTPFDVSEGLLNLSSYFIPDFGWAIEVKFPSLANAEVEIGYKKEGENWVNYLDHKSATNQFYHIHGSHQVGNTSRNLLPGKYEIRLRYKNKFKSSEWMTSSILIPDYVDNK
jgi:membrane protein involved in D-alanine export